MKILLHVNMFFTFATTAAALQQILNVFLYKITEKQKKYTVILRTVNGS